MVFFVMHFSVRLLIMLLFETCLYLIRLGSTLFAIGYHCPPLLERKEGSLEVLIVSWSTVLGRSDCLRGSVHGFVCCSVEEKKNLLACILVCAVYVSFICSSSYAAIEFVMTITISLFTFMDKLIMNCNFRSEMKEMQLKNMEPQWQE